MPKRQKTDPLHTINPARRDIICRRYTHNRRPDAQTERGAPPLDARGARGLVAGADSQMAMVRFATKPVLTLPVTVASWWIASSLEKTLSVERELLARLLRLPEYSFVA